MSLHVNISQFMHWQLTEQRLHSREVSQEGYKSDEDYEVCKLEQYSGYGVLGMYDAEQG